MKPELEDLVPPREQAIGRVRMVPGERGEPGVVRVRSAPPLSLVRRRRLVDGLSFVDGASLQGREVLEGLAARDDAHALAEAGLRTKLLAG
ncbi:MAG: hypothetical protein ACOX6T_22325 [Myxococcales bacterium]